MSNPPIRSQLLPYVDRLAARALATIDLLVVHSTELPDLATARAYGERIVYPSGTGNSGHYYIDRDGSIACFVPLERIAHHVRDINARSIGVELVNLGRFPDWFDSRRQDMTEAYTEAQLAALVALIAWLRGSVPTLAWIAGHDELDRGRLPASDDANLTVRRKLDPGPLFPWQRILHASGLMRLPEHDPARQVLSKPPL